VALNEPMGKYTVQATDVISGKSAAAQFDVR